MSPLSWRCWIAGYSATYTVRIDRLASLVPIACQSRRHCALPDRLPRCGGAAGEPSRPGNEPLPPPARPQPGRLVPVGRGGVRAGPGREQADPALGRVLLLSLVPRDGARVLREPGDRAADERELRQREGRPGGTTRHRRRLHEGRPD